MVQDGRVKPFTFVHAADLHIASPFKGLAGAAGPLADRLRSSTFEAWRRLVELCIAREVDFLLVAGDVYDAEDRSLRAQLALRDGLERLSLAGIQAFVVHGNHDPLDGRVGTLKWPERAHLFGPEIESLPAYSDGERVALVTGVSFPTRKVTVNLAKRFPTDRTDAFQIGLLHCNVGSDTGHEDYAPCELADLTRSAMDYWALGHVHEAKLLSTSPTVAYPGNTQGRNFRETGPRGCLVVGVDASGEVSTERVALDAVRIAELEVDIAAAASVDELRTLVEETIEEARDGTQGRDLLCRIRLTGRGPLAGELRALHAAEDLLEVVRGRFADERPIAWLNAIRLECRPELDLERRRQGGDLVAEVLRVADELVSDPRELAGAAEEALADLLEHHRARRAVERPDDERLTELVRSASLLCVDLLEGSS